MKPQVEVKSMNHRPAAAVDLMHFVQLHQRIFARRICSYEASRLNDGKVLDSGCSHDDQNCAASPVAPLSLFTPYNRSITNSIFVYIEW